MTRNFRSPTEYLAYLSPPVDVKELAKTMAGQTCRLDLRSAGFSLLRLGSDCSSKRLRALMLEVFDELSAIHQTEHAEPLVALSMSRFDQQTTTRPHRDGGPTESLLLLGYEPTPVESSLSIADYSVCADEMGLSPAEFLERHNPMFPIGNDLLVKYTTTVDEFDPRQAQILLINNSAAEQDPPRWQGVLHQAKIPQPREDLRRVVNSMQITKMGNLECSPVTNEERHRFLTDDRLGIQYGQSA